MAGGVAGAAAREALEQVWPSTQHGFPAATFLINLVGAFALGCLLEGLARSRSGHDRRRRARLVLGTGFCGAFTTYSTFAVESVQLARHGAWITGVAYVLASIVGGLLTAAAGIRVAAGRPGWPAIDLPLDPDVDEEPEDQ